MMMMGCVCLLATCTHAVLRQGERRRDTSVTNEMYNIASKALDAPKPHFRGRWNPSSPDQVGGVLMPFPRRLRLLVSCVALYLCPGAGGVSIGTARLDGPPVMTRQFIQATKLQRWSEPLGRMIIGRDPLGPLSLALRGGTKEYQSAESCEVASDCRETIFVAPKSKWKR